MHTVCYLTGTDKSKPIVSTSSGKIEFVCYINTACIFQKDTFLEDFVKEKHVEQNSKISKHNFTQLGKKKARTTFADANFVFP